MSKTTATPQSTPETRKAHSLKMLTGSIRTAIADMQFVNDFGEQTGLITPSERVALHESIADAKRTLAALLKRNDLS